MPLFEFLTNLHNVGNLKTAFVAWCGQMSCIGHVPDVIVLDCSWALIHAILFVFCMQDINQHIQKLWLRMVEDEPLNVNGPSIRLCCSHFIKSVCRRVSKMAVNKELITFQLQVVVISVYEITLFLQISRAFIHSVGLMIDCIDLRSLQAAFEHVIYLTDQSKVTRKVIFSKNLPEVSRVKC